MEVSVQQVIDMTEKELFIKFCKMNKLMPFLMTKFYKKQPIAYKRLNGTYVEYKCNFDDYFSSKVKNNYPILDLYHEIFNELTKWGTEGNDTYRKGLKKWRYFVKNNAKLKSIKYGDKVTFSYFSNDTNDINATVKEIYPEHGTALIKYEDDGIDRTIFISWIKKLNGEDFKKDYYIKYKGKTYGLD